jgi:SAM-dependent methyltransferase
MGGRLQAMNHMDINQHNIEIEQNRRAWNAKPMLRQAYHDLYQIIAREAGARGDGLMVELGSGMGNIKQIIPGCITTDIFPNPWLDRQENAYRLTFEDASVSRLVLFDVWHHLRYPNTALREFHRVLAPGGCVIMMEPAASWIGRIIYGCFHHEPLAMRDPIAWDAPSTFSPGKMDYYAAQANATRIFWNGEKGYPLEPLVLYKVKPIVSLAYCATGGFSRRQIGGSKIYKFLRLMDRCLSLFPRVFATRLLVVLEKR